MATEFHLVAIDGSCRGNLVSGSPRDGVPSCCPATGARLCAAVRMRVRTMPERDLALAFSLALALALPLSHYLSLFGLRQQILEATTLPATARQSTSLSRQRYCSLAQSFIHSFIHSLTRSASQSVSKSDWECRATTSRESEETFKRESSRLKLTRTRRAATTTRLS